MDYTNIDNNADGEPRMSLLAQHVEHVEMLGDREAAADELSLNSGHDYM